MASTIDPTTGLPITNQAIPTSALSTPQTPLTVVPPADTTPILNSALNTGASTVQQGLDAVTLEQKAAQEQQKRVEGAGTVADLTRMAGGRLQERANLAQTNGENELLKQISGYNTQAQGLIREATAIPLQTGAAYQGSSGTQAGVASVNRDLLQRNALQSLTLAQSAAIAQGNYDVAKNLADQQVNAKSAQIDAEIAARKINEEALYKNVTDPAIKKALEARMALTKKEEQLQAEKKAAETAVNNMLIEASPVAPPDVIAKATKIKNEGGSAIQVAAALGKYGGDFLKNELLKEQIKTQVSNRTTDELQRKKLQAEINSINTKTSNLTPQPTGKVTAPNGDAIGLPNETLSAIGRLKLNEGQANAVAFTSRMIQSNQALDKQLGTINPKGGFYETTGYDPTSAGSAIGRFTGSDQSRVYVTNSSDFIRAKLRKESGATISPEEMSADAAIYTPSGAGLDEKDLLLAKTKRDEAIKSMIAQAGPAAPYLQQYYEQAKTQGETFTSENPQLNDWYKNTTNAVNTSTAQATTGAASYGFVDNITK